MPASTAIIQLAMGTVGAVMSGKKHPIGLALFVSLGLGGVFLTFKQDADSAREKEHDRQEASAAKKSLEDKLGSTEVKLSATQAELTKKIGDQNRLLTEILFGRMDTSQPGKKTGISAPKTIVGSTWGLTPDQIKIISERMRPFAGGDDRGDLIWAIAGNNDSEEFASQLVEAFRSAGWNLPGIGYGTFSSNAHPIGIVIRTQPGSYSPRGFTELATAFYEAGIYISGEKDATMPLDNFRIVVGIKPPRSLLTDPQFPQSPKRGL
jgi:hypothetical protein